jgi:hypothetical protein
MQRCSESFGLELTIGRACTCTPAIHTSLVTSVLYNRHLLLHIVLKSTSRFVFKIPLSMNSTMDIVGWAPEPRGRGTVGLFWSCFATMFLCTWNAIHPNLPGLEDSKPKTFVRRVGLLLLCLIAPEVLAINAFNQFREAVSMRTKVRSSLVQLFTIVVEISLVTRLVSQTNLLPRNGRFCCRAGLSTRGSAS